MKELSLASVPRSGSSGRSWKQAPSTPSSLPDNRMGDRGQNWIPNYLINRHPTSISRNEINSQDTFPSDIFLKRSDTSSSTISLWAPHADLHKTNGEDLAPMKLQSLKQFEIKTRALKKLWEVFLHQWLIEFFARRCLVIVGATLQRNYGHPMLSQEPPHSSHPHLWNTIYRHQNLNALM